MKRPTFNEINITPLTDIFLVLLIIMMVIAPMLDQQGLKLSIPDYVEQQEKPKDSKILTVVVTADNKYLINGEEVSAKALGTSIKEESKTFTDGLMIEADGNSDHGTVVRLMDEARGAGVESISITEI